MPASRSFLRKCRRLPLTYLNFKTSYQISFCAMSYFIARNLPASGARFAKFRQAKNALPRQNRELKRCAVTTLLRKTRPT